MNWFEKSKRAMRRHHHNRLKRKRKTYYDLFDDEENYILSETPAPCSCWLCGNPRKTFKEKTVQEKRADVDMHMDVLDLDINSTRN